VGGSVLGVKKRGKPKKSNIDRGRLKERVGLTLGEGKLRGWGERRYRNCGGCHPQKGVGGCI